MMQPSDQTDVQQGHDDPACGARSKTSSAGVWRRVRGRVRSERGQAAVEFALVLPILLLLITAIMQFGSMYNQYITLTDAARIGARALAVNAGTGDPCDSAVSQTVNAAVGTTLTASQVSTTFSGSGTDSCGSGSYPNRTGGTETSGDQAKVSITGYTYTFSLFGLPLIPVNLNPSASEAIE